MLPMKVCHLMMDRTDVGLAVPPVTDAPRATGYGMVRFNALKHGILSRYTVLSHESAEDYESLVNALMQEHLPAGATEQHLIEELASVIWRKRRVLQAEGAIINQGLKISANSAKTIIPAAAPFERGLSGDHTDLRDVMEMTPNDVNEQKQSAAADIDAMNAASAILRRGGQRAYGRAVKVLSPDLDEWWRDAVKDGTHGSDAIGLAAFLEQCVRPLYLQEKEARHHDAILSQVQGEGLQAWKLLPLNRYETQLDRKFERTLGMLIKLKELRTSR